MIIGEKYLPIGSVCLLKNVKKKVMIMGYCIMPKNKKNVIYDYSGCLYPEGVLSSDKTIFFNHDEIDKVYYKGYCDEDFDSFMLVLKKIISKIDDGEIDFNNIDV